MNVSKARLARFREAVAAQGARAALVRDTSNIQWLTAFDDVFDSESAHALYVDESRAVLHTDSRYSNACELAAAATGGLVSIDAARETHAQFAARCLVEAQAVNVPAAPEAPAAAAATASAGFAFAIEDSVTLAEYRKLEAAMPEVPICETSALVLSLRAVKDAEEIRRMRAAQAITDAAFAHIVRFMRPRMTEREIQLELEGFMLRAGASGLAFSSIVATGANGANPHAIPGETRLEAGQCVVLDFGARVFGYCSDMTRMVFVGEPDARLREAYAVLREANERVEAFLKPGVTGAEAHELAERVLEEGGFGGKMGHGLGHGVGIDIHEEPVLAPRNKLPLQVGNVVTVEPGIYLPGEFGMRLEDFGVIVDGGFEVFTRSTHDLVIV